MTENAQVEQRHRDAAADLHSDGFVKDAFRSGQYDDTEWPQAFARFEASLNRSGQEFDAGEAVAWMYSAEREEPFTSVKRWPPAVVEAQCWIETPLYASPPPPQADAEVERKPCPDLMREDHGEAVEWITANCTAIRRDNGDMDYSLGAMIAAYEAGKAAPQADADLIARAREAVINSPETADFMAGVPVEAAHQRERWGVDHDAGKTPFAWFWLIGHLAQKAADAASRGDVEKAKHHTISTAAALANWHAALTGADTRMRPGIAPPAALGDGS